MNEIKIVRTAAISGTGKLLLDTVRDLIQATGELSGNSEVKVSMYDDQRDGSGWSISVTER